MPKKLKEENEYDEQAKKILETAEEYGLKGNYFFKNSFNVYAYQVKTLKNLSEAIEKDGTITTKEYIKGRENIYVHPAIKEYNNTANSLAKTTSTIMKIIKGLEDKSEGEEEDPFMKAINGGDDDDKE